MSIELALLALIGVMLGVGGYCVHRFLQVIQATHNPRATEAERMRTHQLIERLLEKRETPDTVGTAQLHAQERIHEMQQTSTTDRREIEMSGPAPIHLDDSEVAAEAHEAMYQ